MVEVKLNIPDELWAAIVRIADGEGLSARDMVLDWLAVIAEATGESIAPDEEE